MGELLPSFFAIAGALCLVLVLWWAWLSVRVLLSGSRQTAHAQTAGSDGGRGELLREKETLLSAIREVRFEHDLGKVSDADLAQLEQRYRGRARQVLRILDEEIEPHRETARALIEAAREQATAVPSAPVVSSSTCSACGTSNDADARFCKKCGGKLGTGAET
jgi:ribosomal protein L40E